MVERLERLEEENEELKEELKYLTGKHDLNYVTPLFKELKDRCIWCLSTAGLDSFFTLNLEMGDLPGFEQVPAERQSVILTTMRSRLYDIRSKLKGVCRQILRDLDLAIKKANVERSALHMAPLSRRSKEVVYAIGDTLRERSTYISLEMDCLTLLEIAGNIIEADRAEIQPPWAIINGRAMVPFGPPLIIPVRPKFPRLWISNVMCCCVLLFIFLYSFLPYSQTHVARTRTN